MAREDEHERPFDEAEAQDEASSAADPVEPEAPASLEEQLELARAQSAEHFDRFLRAKADIDNILKRHQREMSERARYDGESLARDVVQVVDDLERALGHSADSGSGLAEGVELVLKGLLAALKRHGVERIETEGQPFDPATHEAVVMAETVDVAPNHVVAEFRPGYRMHDRLLRAAMVSVAKPPAGDSGGS